MKELREMTKEEINTLDGKMVVKVYSDFDEKVNGCETEYDKKPFHIFTIYTAHRKYYTDDDGMYVVFSEYTGDNGKVTVTSIYKAA